MRQLRPEYYSDSNVRSSYILDAGTLEYHLETITSRNQTHDFEIFCRKLCERTICPHLKPATGPEGGGDSKADTETIPVADEIANLTYIGEANAGHERWAFAFSAKKKWKEKIRNDVAGIIETQRGYHKIYCVTAHFARAKDRAELEDELSKKYEITVTILDRSWIVEQIIGGDRKDIAFNYLSIGQEAKDTRRLGPTDYSRVQQLDDLENELSISDAFAGMEMQRATEALVAAKLSRNLERPRTDTDGRFARAVRLAEQDGTYRQRLEAHYEWIWTTFWWFDDINHFNNSYDGFENLVVDTIHAKNIEYLCNLAQLLFNCVIHNHLTISDAKLEERIARLTNRLKYMAAEKDRPNNALEAQVSLLVIQINQVTLNKNHEKLGSLWLQFSQVVQKAKGLSEFSFDRLIQMIEVFGEVAGNDPSYTQLIDDVAELVSERTGEAQGALILLKRAKKLDFESNFEMIRLLGKAARQLAKKEHAESLIEALQLLTLAYRSAGLLWAARASCIFAIAAMCIEADENNDIPVTIVPLVMLFGWITIELQHLPDMLEAVRFIHGCVANLPLDDESKDKTAKRLEEIDLVLGSQILNYNQEDLQQAVQLPDVLELLGFHHSRSALLYALGHEDILREEGSIPKEEAPEQVADLFRMFASQPASQKPLGSIIFNESSHQAFTSRIQGLKLNVLHTNSQVSILAAETLIGSIEALFATSLELGAIAHTEKFTITILEKSEISLPDFQIDAENMTASVQWPNDLTPASYDQQVEVQRKLIALAAAIFIVTCYMKNSEQVISHLLEADAVLDRIAMIVGSGNSRQRAFGKQISRLSDWTQMAKTTFPIQASRPSISRVALNIPNEHKKEDGAQKLDTALHLTDHREIETHSIIDVHLWDRALWSGTAFADYGSTVPPVIALVFKNEDAAKKIFTRWRERLGQYDQKNEIYLAIIRGVSEDHPAHYRLLITSNISSEGSVSSKQKLIVASRMQTMHADSDTNLRNFLFAYDRSNSYLLVPAIKKNKGMPKFLMNFAILKKNLYLKEASDINEHDIETIVLGNHRHGTNQSD